MLQGLVGGKKRSILVAALYNLEMSSGKLRNKNARLFSYLYSIILLQNIP